MPTAQLSDRAVILVDGPDAEHFLQNIVTTDLDQLGRNEARPGALLTPQGKIMFDFLISRTGETGFLLDCRADAADDFIRRLTMYRLRAKADISRQDQVFASTRWENDSIASSSGSGASQSDSGWLADTRFPPQARVGRRYGEPVSADAGPQEWLRLRIAHSVAESGEDFAPGDAFPHDVLLDQNGGVGFRKGCYVGQEVVSRMQHRGTARRRVMIARGDAALPASGTEVKVNDRVIGALGSVAGEDGLAIVRIDRVKDALDAGQAITAGNVRVELSIPGWAAYTLPQGAAGTEEA